MLTLQSVRRANCTESMEVKLLSSSCKADLQDPSWVPVGAGTSLVAPGLKHGRCRTFLWDLKSSQIFLYLSLQ